MLRTILEKSWNYFSFNSYESGEDGSQQSVSPPTEDASWEFIPPHHSALNRLGKWRSLEGEGAWEVG